MHLSVRLAAILTIVAAPAFAADVAPEPPPPPPATPESGWTLSVAPYFWMAGLSGDIGVGGLQPVDVDMSFGDILDDLEFGGMVVSELHNGQWGFLADLIYVSTSSDSGITRTIGGIPVALDAGVDTTSFTATLMGEYRVVSNPRSIVDLMAGVRIWSIDNDISATLSAGGTPVAAFSGSDGDTWVDPMLGVKARMDLNERWFVNGWGMIGGFGAGSDLTWDVLAAVGYQWTDRVSSEIGYRSLGVDYEEDGFTYDVVQQGPILGLLIRF